MAPTRGLTLVSLSSRLKDLLGPVTRVKKTKGLAPTQASCYSPQQDTVTHSSLSLTHTVTHSALPLAQESNDARVGADVRGRGASSSGFSRCLPPPRADVRALAEYQDLGEVAWLHHRVVAARYRLCKVLVHVSLRCWFT